MEIITIQCPHCKGSLHLDKGTEKSFCNYCRAEVIVKDVEVMGSVTLESLVKRGFLALEYAEWDRAADSFDQATLINPEHAMIYVGKLMAELKLKQEIELGDHFEILTGYINYQKGVRFAGEELKTRLEGYNEKIEKRIAAEKAEEEKKRLAHQKELAAAKVKEREKQEKWKLEQEEKERQERERREADAPRRRRNWIIIFSILVLFFIGWNTIRVIQEHAEEQRIIAEQEAEAQRLEEERLAEEQRLLEEAKAEEQRLLAEAEAARQEIWSLIEQRINEGYDSWDELLTWATRQGIVWNLYVNDEVVEQEVLDKINLYGFVGNYINATPQIDVYESGDGVLLALHFEYANYQEAVAELAQLNDSSEDDLNYWLENGGLDRLETTFKNVIIEDQDETNRLIEDAPFGKEFISWRFETNGLVSFENSKLSIERIYQITSPTREELHEIAIEVLSELDRTQYLGLGATGSVFNNIIAELFGLNIEWLDEEPRILSIAVRYLASNGEQVTQRNQPNATIENFVGWEFTYSYFNDGLSQQIIIEKTFDMNPDAPGISRSNFDLIHDGMTLEEVATLLGSVGTVSSSAGNLEMRSWQNGMRIIVISFQDGLVTSKSQSGL